VTARLRGETDLAVFHSDAEINLDGDEQVAPAAARATLQ
jgi:hypothetical protein